MIFGRFPLDCKIMNRCLHKFFVYGLNFLGFLGVGLLLLVLVYSLPIARIDSNVAASARCFQDGPYPIIRSWCTSQLDLYTDGLKLLEAADNSEGNAFEKALMVNHGVVDGFTPDLSLFRHYQKSIEFTKIVDYPRYWHGFLVVLKPALFFLTYKKILFFNTFLQVALSLFICFLMVKRNLSHYVIPYLITYLMLMPEALARCLQFSTCYYLFSLSIVFLLVVPDRIRGKHAALVFFYIGMLTSYFDLLTYPLVTLGLPAAFLVVMQKQQMEFLRLVEIVFTWFVGYLGMWASKWVVASCFLEKNVIADALDKVALRMSDSSSVSVVNFTISQSIVENYKFFSFTPATLLLLLFLFVLFVLVARKIKSIASVNYKRFLPYVLVSIMPIVWFSFVLNHSCVHVFFTNKICSISVMAILFGCVDFYGCIKNGSEITKEAESVRNSSQSFGRL